MSELFIRSTKNYSLCPHNHKEPQRDLQLASSTLFSLLSQGLENFLLGIYIYFSLLWWEQEEAFANFRKYVQGLPSLEILISVFDTN